MISCFSVQNVTVNVEQDEENNVGNMHIPVPIVIRFPAQQNGQDVDDLAERLSEVRINLQLNVSSRCSKK